VYFLHSVARKSTRGAAEDTGPTSAEKNPAAPSAGHLRRDDLLFDLYNASMGRPTAAMRQDYQRQMGDIVAVSNYQGFLRRIGCDYSPAEMTVLLRNGVRACCSKKYGGMHIADVIGGTSPEALLARRTETERSGAGGDISWEEAIAAATPERMAQWQSEKRAVWEANQKEKKEQQQTPPQTPVRARTVSGSSSCSQGSEGSDGGSRHGAGGRGGLGASRRLSARGSRSGDQRGVAAGGSRGRGGGRGSASPGPGPTISRADSDKNWRRK
jgi:hypothetical protein